MLKFNLRIQIAAAGAQGGFKNERNNYPGAAGGPPDYRIAQRNLLCGGDGRAASACRYFRPPLQGASGCPGYRSGFFRLSLRGLQTA